MLATQQDSEIHIMGSGCVEAYSWYVRAQRNFVYGGDEFTAPDGWSYDLTMESGESTPDKTVIVDHDKIVDAMRLIADGNVHNVSTECERACTAFLHDPEDADFDACSADEVLQVLAYGEVVYG